jgi:hypothetical protein
VGPVERGPFRSRQKPVAPAVRLPRVPGRCRQGVRWRRPQHV